MSAFASGIDMIFTDPNLALDAVWHPAGSGAGSGMGSGAGQPVRVIRRAPDRIGSFGEARFVTDSVILDLRTSEVAELARGDVVEIGAERFEIMSDPLRDSEQLIWSADARRL